MQRDPDKRSGVGGHMIYHRPRLVLSLTGNKNGTFRMTIRKAKHTIPRGENLKGMLMDYKIADNLKIVPLNKAWKRNQMPNLSAPAGIRRPGDKIN